VSPRARIWLLVGAASLVAAGVVVGATLLTRNGTPAPSVTAKPQTGVPPLLVDVGVRTDGEATAMKRGLELYQHGKRKQAAALFSRFSTVEAQVGKALADWPRGFDSLVDVARNHPTSGLAQLELGLALYWQGRVAQAQAAWQDAKRIDPDSSFAIHAADLLHPQDVPGLPYIVPSFPLPASFSHAPTAALVDTLAERAKTGGARDKLRYGLILRQLGHPLAAEKQFRAAAKLAPNDVDARIAAAVGRFDKDRPALAFSQLGPLTKLFPKAVEVRFHLGLMLLWIHQVAAGKVQLRKVIAAGPSPYATSARQLLAGLGK
jgi:tetratricopeptide (TPR) repeat protein